MVKGSRVHIIVDRVIELDDISEIVIMDMFSYMKKVFCFNFVRFPSNYSAELTDSDDT